MSTRHPFAWDRRIAQKESAFNLSPPKDTRMSSYGRYWPAEAWQGPCPILGDLSCRSQATLVLLDFFNLSRVSHTSFESESLTSESNIGHLSLDPARYQPPYAIPRNPRHTHSGQTSGTWPSSSRRPPLVRCQEAQHGMQGLQLRVLLESFPHLNSMLVLFAESAERFVLTFMALAIAS